MSFVLAYQKDGSDELEMMKIPMGTEDAVDKIIAKGNQVKFRNGLELNHDEIKGIFTEKEYERFKKILFEGAKTAEPGKKSFLELGMKMKKEKSIAKVKHS